MWEYERSMVVFLSFPLHHSPFFSELSPWSTMPFKWSFQSDVFQEICRSRGKKAASSIQHPEKCHYSESLSSVDYYPKRGKLAEKIIHMEEMTALPTTTPQDPCANWSGIFRLGLHVKEVSDRSDIYWQTPDQSTPWILLGSGEDDDDAASAAAADAAGWTLVDRKADPESRKSPPGLSIRHGNRVVLEGIFPPTTPTPATRWNHSKFTALHRSFQFKLHQIWWNEKLNMCVVDLRVFPVLALFHDESVFEYYQKLMLDVFPIQVDASTLDTFQRHDIGLDAAQLFHAVQPTKIPLEEQEADPLDQRLKRGFPELYPFQRRTVAFMLAREGFEDQQVLPLDPYWRLHPTLNIYINYRTLQISATEPTTTENVFPSLGGILAEEMGLGKVSAARLIGSI